MPNQLTRLKTELLKPGRKFTIPEARKIVNEIHDHCLIDTNDRFHNPFFHEICPLLLIAEHVSDRTTSIRFTGTNTRFNGLIFLGDEKCGQIVEMTAAIDGHNDALQMELLEQRGHAPGFVKIQAVGNKRNRIFGKNETNSFSATDYDQKTLLPRLESALALKKRKAPKNPHYTNAWLGIVFDDWISPRSVSRKKRRFDPICKKALGDASKWQAPFSRVYFVGISRLYLFDSCVAN